MTGHRHRATATGARWPGPEPRRPAPAHAGTSRAGPLRRARPSGEHPGEDADGSGPRAAEAVVDVFVYLVVLGLFAEFFPGVISEGFALSLLTAVLLKGVLEIVFAAKKAVVARFRAASTPGGRVAAGVLVWAVVFGSKLLVLEAVDLVLGGRVQLGGFVSVTLLIFVLLAARSAVRRVLRPGPGVPVETT